MTPGDLINLALKSAGVLGEGQTAAAEDSQDALKLLNMMIGQWARKRWLVYHLVTHSIQCDGSVSYTIGPGADIVTTQRPFQIEAAFARQTVNTAPNEIDYPLKLIPARETYNQIALKSLNSFPTWLYYDAAFPQGVLYPWPVPSNIYALHVTVMMVLAQFADLVTEINLPPEYEEAIMWNLAGRLRPVYGKQPDPTVTALARASLGTLRSANAQIPLAQMPTGLVRPGLYNIFSDQVY